MCHLGKIINYKCQCGKTLANKNIKEGLMKKFLKFGAALTALVLGLACFVSCSSNDDGSTSLSVTLTGSEWGYKMSDYSYGSSYYTKGYITHNGYITKESDNVAGEFNITGTRLYIKIYEGQTLYGNIVFYIFDSESNYRIGRVYTTKNNDKFELHYEEY